MSGKKITQLFKIYWPDNGGGIAKVMESIAGGLPEYRQEILVCQQDRHKKSKRDYYQGVPVFRCRQWFDLLSTPVSFRYLYEVKKRTEDSDLVIYHFPYPVADLAVLFGLYSGKLVVWWHCGYENYRWLAPFYRPLVCHTLRKADRIFVSSKGNIRNSQIPKRYWKKCRVVPFSVSDACLERGRAYAAKSAGQDAESFGRERVTILFIGRLVWYKGCDILLRAFAQMRELGCRLVLVGAGPLEQELRKLSCSLGLSNVEFTGMVSEEEKMRRIEQCDFLVLPSTSKAEAFAVVQLEAMAFAKPVINTALPSGVPTVSIDGITGKTVAPGSVRELAGAMRELAEDEALRRKYGRNALRLVQKKYTQELMTERYRSVLHELIGGLPSKHRTQKKYTKHKKYRKQEKQGMQV